jgi:hypothetical protein
MNKNLFLDHLLNGEMTIKDETTKNIRVFHPNESQKKIAKIILNNLIKGKKTKLVIVKGRQVGGSSLIQRMQLDFALNFANFNCYVQAHDQPSASRMFLENIKNVFEKMDFVKDLYETSLDNVTQLYLKKYKGNLWNSEVRVGTSARSGQIDFLHISEAGKIGDLPKKWDELVRGTLEAGEQSLITVIETTAEGKNLFYEWVEGIKSNPDWEILFLSWMDKKLYVKTPPETDEWLEDYKLVAQDYSLEPKPMEKYGLSKEQFYWYFLKAKSLKEGIKKEYPLSIDEAFATSSKSFFVLRVLEKAIKEGRKIKPVEIEKGDDWKLEIYKQPNPNEYYFAGVDLAGEGKDNYSCDILDENGEQVVHMSGQFKSGLSPNSTVNFYNELWSLLETYNLPFLTVEVNFGGETFQNDLIVDGYPTTRLWRDTTISNIGSNVDRKFGWRTTASSRPSLLQNLKMNFEDGKTKVYSLDTLKQFGNFVIIDGKWQASAGQFDDGVISYALALQSKIFAYNSGS